MINAWTEPLIFEVPETDHDWHTVINTDLEPSYYAYGKMPFSKHQYTVNEKSIVVLMSRLY